MKWVLIIIVMLSAVFSSANEEPRMESAHPFFNVDGVMMGIQSGQWQEKTNLKLTSGKFTEDQNYWMNSLQFGLDISLNMEPLHSNTIYVLPQIGLGSVFYTGDFLMDFTVETGLENHGYSPLLFGVALGPNIKMNLTRSYLGSWGINLPLYLKWRRVMLRYTPSVGFPISKQEQKVFEGNTIHSVRTSFVPLSFGVFVEIF